MRTLTNEHDLSQYLLAKTIITQPYGRIQHNPNAATVMT